MQIVTGKTGTPHVTSQQFRQFVEGTVGQESYILNSAENLEPELVTNNKLKIRSGMMCHHGNLSVVEIGTYDEVTIPNGTQGMKRVILIANRYTRNEETGIEECEWYKFIGVSDPDEFKMPNSVTEGNLQNGDLVDDCPVFEIHQDGLNVTEIKKLLPITPDIPTINASLSQEWTQIYSANNNTIHVIKIGHIVFGRFSIQMPDTTERTLTFSGEYAPAQSLGVFIPAIRNGEIAANAWLSRNDTVKGTFTYKAKEGNYGTYSCTTIWFAN